MLPRIKIKDIENELFTINGVNNHIVEINHIDFVQTTSIPNIQIQNIYPTIITPVVYRKQVNLTPLHVNVKYNTIDDIKQELTKKFIIKITELGKKHREKSEIKNKLDIDIKKLESRKIISKFISNGSNITVQGRIGPGQFLISNSNTYKDILKRLVEDDINITYNDKLQLTLTTLTYFIDNSVEDDIVLMGRKNKIDTPGVHCSIEIDENGFIKFKECQENIIKLFYSIYDIGYNPEYQYYAIFIRDILYIRNKKLNKIKEIYD
jgi:hypothetical protein